MNDDTEVRCRRCKRVLRNPASRVLGIGAVCARKETALSMLRDMVRRASLYGESSATLPAPGARVVVGSYYDEEERSHAEPGQGQPDP